MSAIVCGDSLRRSAAVRSGGTRCRNSNGGVSVRAESRPRTSAARSGPSARSITPRAKSRPPATPNSRVLANAASSLKIESVVSAPTELRLAISIERLSISSSASRCSTFAARSDPSAAIRTAALRAPGTDSTVAGRRSVGAAGSAGTVSAGESPAIRG